MPKPKNTLVFFGNERLATAVATEVPILRSLIAAGYNVAGVVSNYSKNQSRNSRALEIKTVAKQYDIQVWLPERTLDIMPQLKKLRAEIGVLVAYGKIVPQSIIDIFPKGIINIHPSLLPSHRGPTPIESVILEDADRTGVSLMQLAKDMDAGSIYAQSEIQLNGNETKQELADQLLEIGGMMLIELLPQIISGAAVALPQDNRKASYDNLINKNDGIFNWNKPAEHLEREIRAYAGWPKSQAKVGGLEVIILKARVSNQSGQPGSILADKQKLIIYCGQNALEILQLQPAGKQIMSAQAFLNGYGKRLMSS